MTRFPKIRRLISASAIVVPCLIFSSFLLFASGSYILSVVVVVLAFILFLAFPPFIAIRQSLPPNPENHVTGICQWVHFTAKNFVFFWAIIQPEFTAFQVRVIHGGALWDWKLIAPIAILTAYYIYIGIRRVPQISDRAIYSYLTSSTFEDQHQSPKQ